MPHILVVDDDDITLPLLKQIFEIAGYDVDCASNAIDGLEMAQHSHPSLAIVDLRLPEVNGFTLIKQFKSDNQLKDMRVIVLTADNSSETRKYAAMLGCDLFVEKPFFPRELISAAKELISQ